MRIGELARQCNVNPKTIRYYEAAGLMPRAARSLSGHRMYSEQDRRRLLFIRRAKQIGLPLARIGQIATYVDTASCQQLRPRLKKLVVEQLAEIEGRLKELRTLQRELRERHASLSKPKAKPPTDAGCSCLDGTSKNPAIPPGAALVKRSSRENILTRRR